MKYIIWALLLVLSSKVSLAQNDSTTISFFITPTPKTFKVGDSLLITGNKMKLEPGTYSLKAWIPTYELLDTSFTIKPGAEPFNVVLRAEKRTSDYLDYQAKSNRHQKR